MQGELHTKYALTIEVLTPLHIGNGNELLRGYDYVADGGRTWVIDQKRLLEAALGEGGEFDNTLLSRPPAELLRPSDFQEDSPFFRYVMPGEPTNRPLREQIKDTWGNPYLPGSSVKGLLRTLLLWGIYTAEKDRVLDLSRADNRRSWAALPLEREVFAPGISDPRQAPNKDLLKALRVSDSEPVAADALHVATTLIYPTSSRGGSRGVNIDVEALRSGTILQIQIAVEEYGFIDGQAQRVLGWGDLRKWFGRLPAIGRSHGGVRLGQEVEFHQNKGPKAALNFLTRAVKEWEALADNEWLAQIGWGASWHSKTLNNLLTDQPGFEQAVVKKYNLARGRRQPGDPFPKSRNLVLQNGQPAIPMGWVKCRLEPL